MPIKVQFGGVSLTGDVQEQPSEMRPEESGSGSVRIGLIGDFRGRGTRGPVESGRALQARRCLRVDRDDLDAVLARLDVGLTLTVPCADRTPISFSFRELDDFHPDRIVARAGAFAALRETREQLEDQRTFEEAAARMGRTSRAEAPSPSPPPPAASEAAPADLLDRILQQTSTSRPQPAASAPTGAWQGFLEQITAPHIRREDPRQADLIAGVEVAMAQLLREILHHPEFQALESLWRAVDLLTRRIETDAHRTIELIDLTRTELEADLLSSAPLQSTAAFKLLVEPSVGTEGGRPWTFLVGDFTFGPSRRDVALLWRLGQLARLAGAPFLAAASPRFLGSDAIAATPDPDDWGPSPADEGWADLRRSAEATYLGLALPRVLLRAPYGPDSRPIESFAFEELSQPAAHESYLWANPALALAALLEPAIDATGQFDPRRFDADLTELPVALERTEEGDRRLKPCAEVGLDRRAVARILDAGLMALQSVRDQGMVRLAGLVSIADPAAPLDLR